jgi:hypothetical protein
MELGLRFFVLAEVSAVRILNFPRALKAQDALDNSW